jgi:lysyl-tRNA synthetase class 2
MKPLLAERARIVAGVRRFFESRCFVEVQTPVLVPSPGLDVHLDAFEAARAGVPERSEAAGTTPGAEPARYLITSPEYQMKRLLADGWTKIFQIVPCFRRGERGALHNPEFTMLEWYRAHACVADVMRDTEQLVAAVTGGAVRVGERTPSATSGVRNPRHVSGPSLRSGLRTIDTRPPFATMTVCEAFERFAGMTAEQTLDAAAHDENRYFRALVDRVEPAIASLDHALFLTEYPSTQASLARKKPGDERVAERFELYVAGIELCNGFGELVDVHEQRARLERDQAERRARGLPVYPIDERFLEALARGIPPSGGNALGLDRLVALACGTTNVADVIAFADDEL